MNLTTPQGVVDHMKQATDDEDWDRRCNDVKKANGGNYPKFWFQEVIMAEVYEQALNKAATISATTVNTDGTSMCKTWNVVTGELLP